MTAGETASPSRRLLAILAHPDDECLGMGGTLVHYARQGVATHLVTATLGQKGRFYDDRPRPSDEEVGRVREAELRAAVDVLGVDDVRVLGHMDSMLDSVDPAVILPELVREIRRVRPQVVVTFGPYGAYGHPDHIAISQFTSAAVVAAADPDFAAAPVDTSGVEDADGTAAAADPEPGRVAAPHAVAKLYYMAWDEGSWAAYQEAFKQLTSQVDGEERHVMPWPAWSLTARIDTRDYWETVWEAVQCHETQMAIYGKLAELTPEHHQGLWGDQTFYRAFSTVNGGRETETDLFEGLD